VLAGGRWCLSTAWAGVLVVTRLGQQLTGRAVTAGRTVLASV
jgi:hypothetical protein